MVIAVASVPPCLDGSSKGSDVTPLLEEISAGLGWRHRGGKPSDHRPQLLASAGHDSIDITYPHILREDL